jgi:hypothetical protein
MMATEELNSGCSRKDAASREAFLAYPARVRGVKASSAWVSTRHSVGWRDPQRTVTVTCAEIKHVFQRMYAS